MMECSIRYCFDTSALLDGWVRYYPPDAFPSLWCHLDRMITNGSILCPEDVLLELGKQEDDVCRWVKDRQHLLARTLGVAEQAVVSRIMSTHPNLVDVGTGKSGGDPFVIALAKINGLTVVTGEKFSKNPAKPKIPDVCAAYGVPCINILQFIRDQKLKF